MPLKLPEFSDPFLADLLVCAFSAQLFGRVKEFEGDAQYGDGHWIRLKINPDAKDKMAHVHFDIVKSFPPSKTPATSTIDEIGKLFDSLGTADLTCWVRATYRVPAESKPTKGLIAALAVPTEFGGDKFALTGGEIEFSTEPFDELKWSKEKDGKVRVSLDGIRHAKLSDDYLVIAEQFIRRGINRFVFGALESAT